MVSCDVTEGPLCMAPLCSTCNNLQVDATTNETPDETSLPEPERLKTFVLDVDLPQWRKSAEGGCSTCRLIWDGLLHFHGDWALKLSEMEMVDEDGPVSVNISGRLGQTLLLELYPLPKGQRFPGLEFYSPPCSPLVCWPIIGSAADIAHLLDLERCLELCKHWITACEQNHPSCQSDRVQLLPTRVLDLGDLDKPVNVRLYESPPSSTACYIALSYCWGKGRNLTTTTANLASRKAGIAWDLLPRSFRDAILICRGLGVRYLWIDAMCIIQDSHSDWEKEAARMAEVYENAFLTIATDGAKDPTRGIFTSRLLDRDSIQGATSKSEERRVKRNHDVLRLPIKDFDGKEHIIHVREPLVHTDIVLQRTFHDTIYPLLTRAWTFQERLLARRTLHFTAFEVVWECKETLFCECGCISREFQGLDGDKSPKVAYESAMAKRRKESEHVSKNEGNNSSENLEIQKLPRMPESTKSWTMMIGGYSIRNLTFISDKLPAISSLARRFAVQDKGNININISNSSSSSPVNNNHSQPESPNPQTYLAGLWHTDLPWLLCFRAFHSRSTHRSSTYCAPTWSWASITTPVIWDRDIYAASSKLRVLDARTAAQGLDAFGSVKGGSITLKGYVQDATLDFNDVETTNPVLQRLGLRNSRNERIFFVPDHEPLNHDNPAQDPSSEISTQRSAFSLSHGDAVICLWVLHNTTTGAVYGLVLAYPEEVSVKRSLGDGAALRYPVFERVGVVTAMSWKYRRDEVQAVKWFSGAEEREIILI